MLSRAVRVVATGGLTLGLAVVTGACGSSAGGSSPATITIAPQSYQSKPGPTVVPESTTAATAGADGRTTQVQYYVIQSGEYPSTVANKFEIPLEDLLNINDFTLEGNIVPQWPGAGATVKIPPGAKFIDPNAAAADDEPETEETTASGGTTDDGAIIESTPEEVIDDATTDRCVPGKYTLEANDYPGAVAKKFDVTVEALNAANASTSGYGSFYVGLEIVIPAADDC
ncbi:MAG: LysM peptidoglycan-binding domain-containing protein [Desertimonas sp.]